MTAAMVVAPCLAAPDPEEPAQDDTIMREFIEIAAGLTPGENSYLGRAELERLRKTLTGGPVPGTGRIVLLTRFASELLETGSEAEAVSALEEALALAERTRSHKLKPTLYASLGLAYLRLAEVRNCIERHNGECCIFPLEGGAVHSNKEPGRKARRYLELYLETDPASLQGRWLLNIAAMALGEYPGGVAGDYLIPPEAFESEHDIGRFPDIAPELGVDTFNLAGGVIVEDMDSDGYLDIVTSTFDPWGPLTHYRNLGGTFEDRSEESRTAEQLGGLNTISADYDSDGDADVLVLRGAWLFDDGRIRKSLLRNDGTGRFTDVTREAGLADPASPTQTAAWADFDNDGDLDLYVGSESRVEQDPAGDYPSQLFMNNGDGTFSDVAREAGVTNDRYCKGVTAADYDQDGYTDIYVSNVGPNRLFRNNGDGTFSDVAPRAGVTEPKGRSFATWFFDHDNDGLLDIFVSSYDATTSDLAADALGLEISSTPPCLYRNRGDGTFEDIAGPLGLDHPYLPMGAGFGDVDNDGWIDIYLGTGGPGFETLMPNVMLWNDGGRRYQDVTRSGGLGHLQKGHGVAFADLDNDGDQDIYHQLGGFFPGDRFSNALFLNPGHGNRFLHVKLTGTASNRGAVGARIRLVLETPAGRRELHRAVGAVSSFGSLPGRQEIGLGDAESIERLEIRWPTSGTTQVLRGVPLDTMIAVTEGREGFEIVPLRRFEFSRRAASR